MVVKSSLSACYTQLLYLYKFYRIPFNSGIDMLLSAGEIAAPTRLGEIIIINYSSTNKDGIAKYPLSIQEAAKNLRIIDDALFRLIAADKKVCEEILRTLLDMPSLTVLSSQVQSVVQGLYREVYLDAECLLDSGIIVNIEVQKGSGNDDIART